MEEVTFIESISLQPDDRMLRMQYADYLELGGQFKEAERQRMLLGRSSVTDPSLPRESTVIETPRPQPKPLAGLDDIE